MGKQIARAVGLALTAVLGSVAVERVDGDLGEAFASPLLWLALACTLAGELVAQLQEYSSPGARARSRQERWSKAVVAFVDDGVPVGLGFVVSPRRVLTSWDVLERVARDKNPLSLWFTVTFPHLGEGDGVVQRQVRYRTQDAGNDVVALEVHEADRVPRSVLPFRFGRPAAGTDVSLFGYTDTGAGPAGETWVAGHVRGTVDGRWLQIDGDHGGVAGPRPGFCGGPVVEVTTGRVVGLMVEAASRDGRFEARALSSAVFEGLNIPARRPQRISRVVVEAVLRWAGKARDQVREAPAQVVGWGRRHRPTVVVGGTVAASVGATLLLLSALGILRPPVAPGPCVVVPVSISTEKDDLVKELAQQFNAEETVDGRCVDVQAAGLTSGGAMEALAGAERWDQEIVAKTIEIDETPQPPPPAVWMPTSTMWSDLLVSAKGLEGENLGSVTASVMAIAVPSAPGNAATMSWAALKKDAESEDFVLGRDVPLYSTSGLATTVAVYDAAVKALPGDSEGVTVDLVENPDVVGWVRDVESSVASYGQEATQYLENLYCGQTAPVDALVLQEQMIHSYNQGKPDGAEADCDAPPADEEYEPVASLDALQPLEGTVVLDHPYLLMPWIDDDQRAVAEAFYAYLTDDAQQDRFLDVGFRRPSDPLTRTDQLRTTTAAEQSTRITVPDATVLEAMRAQWDGVRKKAQVLLLLDTSLSMAGGPLEDVRAASHRALDLLDPSDEVAIWTFADGPVPVADFQPVGDGVSLHAVIDGLQSSGSGTALVNATIAAHEALEAKFPTSSDDERVQAVVLLTDGVNNPPATQEQVDALIGTIDEPEREVRIYTVPYGNETDECLLGEIAARTDAKFYGASTDQENIEDVLLAVFGNFGSPGGAADLPSREAKTLTSPSYDCPAEPTAAATAPGAGG
ncbi:substrate-binding domain-containing protein [Antribacter sp. KLBMP9083]|uniref:Substrate-binding domain-containing protein n=1 Tax=Antribacter soli TaxID=2910976 RepID=A0AA41QI10_9MICO|nr:substrate-binding domain-containing protein [Antribacter soli]MCF4122517.1 substrate-binding domain-containing protein [Antribacter soli]